MGTYFNNYQNGSSIFCDFGLGPEFVDSESRMRCQTIEMLTCGAGPCDKTLVNNGVILCDCEDSYNCNLCGNDRPYFMPIIPGDPLMFQFQQIDPKGQDPVTAFDLWGTDLFANGFVKDCCSGEYWGGNENPTSITTAALDHGTGVFPVYGYDGTITWKNIQLISLNSELLINQLRDYFGPNWDGCFVFEFCFETGTPTEYCFCSEPFKVHRCEDKNDTILTRGKYKDQDCFGYYYGLESIGSWTGNAQGVFQWQNYFRTRAWVEPLSFNISKTFVGTSQKTTSTAVVENYSFRTDFVPLRIAKLLTNILAAKEVYFNSVEFITDGEVSKNNETGSQWYIEASLRIVDCTKLFCQ